MEGSPDDNGENKENWAMSFTQDDCIEWKGGEDGIDLRTLMTPKISQTQLTQQTARLTPAGMKQLKRKLHNKTPTRKSPRRGPKETKNADDTCVEQQVDELFDFLDTKEGSTSKTSIIQLHDRLETSTALDERKQRTTTQLGRRKLKCPQSPDISKRRRTSSGRTRRRHRSMPEPGKETLPFKEDSDSAAPESDACTQNESFEKLLSQLDTNPRGKIHHDANSLQPSVPSSAIASNSRTLSIIATKPTSDPQKTMKPPPNRYSNNNRNSLSKPSSALHQEAPTQSNTIVPEQKYISSIPEMNNSISTQHAGSKNGSLDSKQTTATNVSTNQAVRPPVRDQRHISQPKARVEQTHQQKSIIQNQAPINKYQKVPNLQKTGQRLNTYPPTKNQGQTVETQPAIQNQNQSTTLNLPQLHGNRSSKTASSSVALERYSSHMKPPVSHKHQIQPKVEPEKRMHVDDEFDSLPEFSEEDLACMDALVTAATQKDSLSQQSLAETSAEINRKEIQNSDFIRSIPPQPQHAVGSKMSGNNIEREKTRQPLTDKTNNKKPNQTNLSVEDLFGDLPMLDFDAMDKQIAHRNASSVDTKPLVCKEDHKAKPNNAANFDMTPPTKNRRVKTKNSSNITFISFTRYKVVQVTDDASTYTKTLVVAAWNDSMKHDHNKNIHRMEKVTKLLAQKDCAEEIADGCIFLRGEWYHEKVAEGNIIHLCSLTGSFMTSVDALPVLLHSAPSQSSEGDDLALIVHPDMLVTPTLISEAVSCSRRAVLKSRLGSTGLTSKAALFGTMRHGLFERCMTSHDFSIKSATKFTRSVVREFSEALVGCGVTDKVAQNEVLRVLPQLQRFSREYTAFGAKQNVNRSKLEGLGVHAGIDFTARSVEGTEESAISPELGLKGFIDVTVEAETVDLHSERLPIRRSSESSERKSLMCIELKTGHNQNPQNAHMGQLALYTMMLQVQHGSKIGKEPDSTSPSQRIEHVTGADGGMLLYLNQKGYKAVHVQPGLDDIKSLIGQRNVVANETRKASQPRGVTLSYEDESKIKKSDDSQARLTVHPAPPASLPDLISSSHSCERCYSNRECMMYTGAELLAGPQTSEFSTSINKTHGPLLQHFTGHLNAIDMAYFREWDRLIDLEADACNFNTPEAWLVESTAREKTSGKCMSSLIFDRIGSTSINAAQTSGLDDTSSAEMLDTVVLLKFNRASTSELTTPLSSLKIEPGSHVILSTDTTSFNLSVELQNLSRNHARKTKRLFRHRMHAVRGLMKSATENTVVIQSSWRDLQQVKKLIQKFQPDSTSQDLRFRLDKDEVSTGTGTLRQNLVNLFTSDAEPFLSEKKPTLHIQSQSQKSDSSLHENGIALRIRMSFLRDVIIRLRPPVFDKQPIKSMFNFVSDDPSEKPISIPGCDFMDLAAEYAELNPDQRSAVEKVVSAKDYALIQGLPGTGKTSTISFIVRLLAARGKRVLVSSYTHAAVDNVMMKLMDKGVASNNKNCLSALVRIGKRSSCHPDVQPILVDSIALDREKVAVQPEISDETCTGSQEKPTAENLSFVVSSARIVGVTALSVPRSPLLAGQHFDVVIIDEAGQISQPAILGALMAADSFVLVGDHMQLPPLVTSAAADEGGYGISMLKRLADKFPQSVAQLALQYRMHGDICRLCNDIVYKGSLKCANENVRSRQLKLGGFPSALVACSIGQRSQLFMGWLPRIIDPSRPVVFVDTDELRPQTPSNNSLAAEASSMCDKAPSSSFRGLERTLGNRNNGNIVNGTEVALVRCIVHGLLECGLRPSAIGVISPFRAQLRMFDECQHFQKWKRSGLEFSTIDRYQGRDKEVIILSFVRSNGHGRSGRLLDDFRRLNVAVSRAKRKLVMVGSFKTLHTGSSVLRPVLDGIKKRQSVDTLPGNSLELYSIF